MTLAALAWIGIALGLVWLLFAYVGDPASLWLLRRLSPRPIAAADRFPDLSIVITVHNGAAFPKRKLEQTLSLTYPGWSEVIVTSDGSTDATEEIAASFGGAGVRLVRSAERHGKEAAQARAIPHAKGEVLVFTDVTSEIEPDALRWIVRRGLAVLSAYRHLHPRHGRVALGLWGHKAARFTSPFALLLVLGCSAAASTQSAHGIVILAGQLARYALGGLALFSGCVQRRLVARVAGFFLLVNAHDARGLVAPRLGRARGHLGADAEMIFP